jgi:hypothetical protein
MSSKYNTREIATKLQRYRMFLESEIGRAKVAIDLTGEPSDLMRSLEAEIEVIEEMANYLWDIKESV